MNILFLDVETSSPEDLKANGLKRYLANPATRLNSIQWAWNDCPVELIPYEQCVRGKLPESFLRAWREADLIVAHNAPFEIQVMAALLGLTKPLEQWSDTMARGMYYGYPAGLDALAQALGSPLYKDIMGKQNMLLLATGKYTPEEKPNEFARLYSYGIVDVKVLREIHKLLPALPDLVALQWRLDFEINLRGMPIDTRMLANARRIKLEFAGNNNDRMMQFSQGFIQTVNQTAKIQEFAAAHGVEMPDCGADTITRLLYAGGLPPVVKDVFELRQEAGLASLAKYDSIADRVVDGRLHNQFMWYGAHTGRPTGTGAQVLNLARSDDPEFWADAVSESPNMIRQLSAPTERLKQALRGVICADSNHMLIGCDLAQIEARLAHYVAGSAGLKLFTLGDPYSVYGKTIFGYAINKKDNPVERTAAKASMLSLGFAGGIGAYQRVGENAGINFTAVSRTILPTATSQEFAEAERNYKYYLGKNPLKPLNHDEAIACDILKQRFRRDFPALVGYWKTLEQAFLLGGNAGRIAIEITRSGTRIITLPSGRRLFYHGVKIHERNSLTDSEEEKFEKGYSYQSRHGRKFIWKGTLIENVAQAMNADISDWYKMRANQIAPVIHHCYDEFTVETPKEKADATLEQLKKLTETQPEWCADLPLGFDFWVGRRYGK